MIVFEVYYGHSFFYCFHFMSFVKDMFREFGFAFCISEVFPMFFKSCVDNVVIATKGLQDRNINILAGTTVENKGKLILLFMFVSCKILFSVNVL